MVRIQEIQIKDFKNVEHGIIKFPNKKSSGDFLNSAEVVGVYGQNGSGKTAIVEAFKILKDIMSGDNIPKNISDYIMQGKNSCKFNLTFYLEQAEQHYFFKYNCLIGLNAENEYKIIKEEIQYKEFNGQKWPTSFKTLFSLEGNREENHSLDYSFYPFKLTEASTKLYIDSIVNAKMAEKEGKSFIFSKDFYKTIETSENANFIIGLVKDIQLFSKRDFFIVANSQIGLISGNILIPLNIFLKETKSIHQGTIPIKMKGSATLPLPHYDIVEKVLDNMNIVLNNLVPDLKINIKPLGKELNKDSEEVMRFQLMSVRKDKEIPIEYESEGIKKIISVLSMLIVTYNNPSFALIIDEFDAGIYEYLFGEILNIMSTSGKGQLLFTSHNLRPLEVLSVNNIRFTTTNPKDKYIKMKNVKQNNNLRDTYMRNIILGNDDVSLYEETRDYKIKRAFRLAWNDVNE